MTRRQKRNAKNNIRWECAELTKARPVRGTSDDYAPFAAVRMAKNGLSAAVSLNLAGTDVWDLHDVQLEVRENIPRSDNPRPKKKDDGRGIKWRPVYKRPALPVDTNTYSNLRCVKDYHDAETNAG